MTISKQALMDQEIEIIENWIEAFDANHPYEIIVGPKFESLIIQGFPLPDGIYPDRLEIALLLDHYPYESPIGIYIRSIRQNKKIIKQIRQYLNIFKDQGFHGAPPITGYDWVCLHYANDRSWSFNPRKLQGGDCLFKFLERFHTLCREAC